MKTYTAEELAVTLDKHRKWLDNEEGGERANLTGVTLYRETESPKC
jgi:hypothetical protein